MFWPSPSLRLMGTAVCRTTPQRLVEPQLQLDRSHRDNELANKFLLHQLTRLKVRLGTWTRAGEGRNTPRALNGLRGGYESITDSVIPALPVTLPLGAEILHP